MNYYTSKRVLEEAEYFVGHESTVRRTAEKFDISKSTAYIDLSERIWSVNGSLAMEVRKRLDINKAERHIRGGFATKQKYLLICPENN